MMEEAEEQEGETAVFANNTIKNYIKKGILLKKGMGKVVRPWTLRTMIVYDTNMLRYYDGSKLKGEISLHGTVVHNLSPEQADGREHAFAISNITGLGRSKVAELVLAAGTKVEVDEWIAAIRGATTVTDTFAYQSLKGKLIDGYTALDVSKLKDAKVKERQKNGYAEEEELDDYDEGEEDLYVTI